MAKPIERPPGSGHWRVRPYVGRDSAGKPVYASRTFRAKGIREATRVAREIEVELRTARPERGTFAALMEAYAQSVRGRAKSGSTVKGDRARMERMLKDWGPQQVHTITASQIERWYVALLEETKPNGTPARSPNTVQAYARVFRAHLRYAEKHRWISRSPDRETDIPKGRKPQIPVPPTWLVHQLTDLAETSSPEMGVSTWLGCGAGMRRGEVCALRWPDVDLERATILVHQTIVDSVQGPQETARVKGGYVSRVVYVSPPVVARLRMHLQDCQAYARAAAAELAPDAFVVRDPIDPTGLTFWPLSALTSAWRSVLGKADGHCRFHDLRHWHASHLAGAGESAADGAAQMGHKQTSTFLNMYAHPVDRSRAGEIIGALLERP